MNNKKFFASNIAGSDFLPTLTLASPLFAGKPAFCWQARFLLASPLFAGKPSSLALRRIVSLAGELFNAM